MKHKAHRINRKYAKQNRGFSLIELIIVIAVMAILVGVLAPNLIRYVDRAKEVKMLQEFDDIARVMDMYLADQVIAGAYDAEKNPNNQEQIYVNVGSVAELDKAATKYYQELYPDKIKQYKGWIFLNNADGQVSRQIWIYEPTGGAVQYTYDTKEPGKITESAKGTYPDLGN